MTLQTTASKVTYWLITISLVIAGFVCAIIYACSTNMRNVLFGIEDNKTIYCIECNGWSGDTNNSYWYFYKEDGTITRVGAPRLNQSYKFFKVKFNRNHFDLNTKKSTLGSYEDILTLIGGRKVFYEGSPNEYGFPVYIEVDSGFEGKRSFSILIWVIFATIVFFLPFIHKKPSKKILASLLRSTKYVPYGEQKKYDYFDDNFQLDARVENDEILIYRLYYKGNLVAHDVTLYKNENYVGIRHVDTSEYFWIDKIIKLILPSFKNKMIDYQIEKIFN